MQASDFKVCSIVRCGRASHCQPGIVVGHSYREEHKVGNQLIDGEWLLQVRLSGDIAIRSIHPDWLEMVTR